MMGALRGCRVVKFDSCNNLWSSIHTIFVILLYSVVWKIKQNYYAVLHGNNLITLQLAWKRESYESNPTTQIPGTRIAFFRTRSISMEIDACSAATSEQEESASSWEEEIRVNLTGLQGPIKPMDWFRRRKLHLMPRHSTQTVISPAPTTVNSG